jgi:hypothetical protein
MADSFANQAAVHHPISGNSYPRHCERSEAIQNWNRGTMDCFVAIAPLRKRFTFVAGNDEEE